MTHSHKDKIHPHALVEAAMYGHHDRLHELLPQITDPHTRLEAFKFSMLKHQHQSLIILAPHCQLTSSAGLSHLRTAIINDLQDVVQTILPLFIEQGWTSKHELAQAAKYASSEMFFLLDPHCQCSEQRQNAFLDASRFAGRTSVLEHLLECGVQVTADVLYEAATGFDPDTTIGLLYEHAPVDQIERAIKRLDKQGHASTVLHLTHQSALTKQALLQEVPETASSMHPRSKKM